MPARRLLRPVLYLLSILVWLFVMSLPLAAFLIATRGEIQLGGDTNSNIRIFLVQESEAQGLGLEWSRQHGDTEGCAKTTVRYLLWEGSEPGQGVEYCRCYDPGSGLSQETIACENL